MAPVKPADVSGQKAGECCDTAGKSDPDGAEIASGRPLNNLPGMLGLSDRALGLDAKQGTGFRQLDASAGAFEQRRAECLFQRADLHAKGRLYDVQASRSVSEVPFFGDGKEVSQLSQIHHV
jgi:hypothetical protein